MTRSPGLGGELARTVLAANIEPRTAQGVGTEVRWLLCIARVGFLFGFRQTLGVIKVPWFTALKLRKQSFLGT